MDTSGNNTSSRQAVINGLAVAGFIALIAVGIWLAVYSTRFVPTVVGRIGSAAVYLGSVFTPASTTPSLTVVPTASTTIPFGDETPATTTEATSTPKKIEVIEIPSTAATLPATTKPIVPATTAGKTATSTAIIPAGLPDLMVKITSVGYLTTNSTDSFVANTTAPAGTRPAVSFTIKNIGTNVTGAWTFSSSIPTQTSYIFTSPEQQSLASGDSIDYTMGFDQAMIGANQPILITVNPEHKIIESTEKNNTASTTITILGN